MPTRHLRLQESDLLIDPLFLPEQRRQHPRVPLQRGRAWLCDSHGRVACYEVENFSAGGLLVRGGRGLEHGALVDITLELPGLAPMDLSGVVLREQDEDAYAVLLEDVTAEQEDALQEAVVERLEAARQRRLPRLLIVDDSPEVGRALKRDLEWFDGHIEVAQNTSQALRIASGADTQLDAAIIDLYVGDEDGLSLIDLLRGQWPDLYCILMSGAVRRDQLRLAQLGGRAEEILPKPWDSVALRATIERQLGLARNSGPQAESV